MKKNTAIILFVILFSLSACKKNTGAPSPTGSGNSFSAVIGGSNWKPGFTYAVDSANLIYIMGNIGNNTTDNYPAMFVGIPDTLSSGSIIHFNTNENTFLAYAETKSTMYMAIPGLPNSAGSLTVTKHDKTAKRIEGTFGGTLQNITRDGSSRNITNGQLAITYK